MFVELVEKSIKNRNTIVPMGDIGITPVNFERYISMFPFDKSIIDFVNVHKTIQGHRGIHYCPYILFDVDNKTDLELARQSALQLLHRLEDLFGIYPDELFIYFSGSKGFHIIIHENLFGKLQPRDDISDKIKQFVIQVTEGIDNFDFNIYENHRIIRVVNSINAKTGLYKIQITFDELNTSIENIKRLAESPRPSFVRRLKNSELQKKDRLVKYLADLKKIEIYNTDFESNYDFFKPPVDGERNVKLHKQACALFCNTPFKRDAIIDILQSINLASGNPISLNELNTLCNNAERFAESNQKGEQELDVRTFGGWIPEFIDSIREIDNKITLCFQSFDDEMKGKLKSKMLSLIGYGGTKKSLYAENICLENIIKNGYRCLYSSMEMGSAELMKRFIDMASVGDNYNSSFEIELAERKTPGIAQQFLQQYLIPIFTDKLWITQNSSMTVDKYRQILKKMSVESGACDILVVDGLSMMGGKGKTIEQVDRNSKELKELANEFNIFVIMITHASRGEEKNTKDLSRKARDSEKIIDNCDFHITLSQIFENVKEQKVFEKNGIARLVNKRGSGRSIDVQFQVDEKRLIMTEMDSMQILSFNKNKDDL